MLTNKPNTNAFTPYKGIRKNIKNRFIMDDKILFLKINSCFPSPFNIPDKTTCIYINGHINASKNMICPISWLYISKDNSFAKTVNSATEPIPIIEVNKIDFDIVVFIFEISLTAEASETTGTKGIDNATKKAVGK